MAIKHLALEESKRVPLLRSDHEKLEDRSSGTLQPSNTKDDCSVLFIGTATTIIDWKGFRILTDPNFLHAGDHVHLGPGVTATRRTEPATQLDKLPALDCILLSHYHEDHFDRHVEKSLNRAFPIVTTPHAQRHLAAKEQQQQQQQDDDAPFERVTGLDAFESAMLRVDEQRAVKVTGMPGKHVPPGIISAANDFLQAVPPTNGWLLELGHLGGAGDGGDDDELQRVGYRIYISGDTLLVDDLEKIPAWLEDKQLDLMLVHLGGTTIPGPALPLLMVTMDGEQGRRLMQLMDPKTTIPIHYDDYDVFLSPLAEFKREVDEAGLQDRVVYLGRGERYSFSLRQ
ncbi:hypothetical protein ARSEF1564_000323 [Beauveria bassiana]